MPQPLSSQIVVKFFMGHPLLLLCFWRRTPSFIVWDGSRADDSYSGQTYEYRRGWVKQRLLFLSSVFIIDRAATVSALAP
jgi:hypothetical protein